MEVFQVAGDYTMSILYEKFLQQMERDSQMIPKGKQCCRGMQNNPRAAGTSSRGKALPMRSGVSGLPLHGYKPEETQVKWLEFPRYKIDYIKGTFIPMITVPRPLVYHPSSLSLGMVQHSSKFGCVLRQPIWEPVHCTPTHSVFRAAGAENISYFQCCRKQNWFGEGIKTKAKNIITAVPTAPAIFNVVLAFSL